MIKKLLIGLGSVTAVVLPVALTVSCGDEKPVLVTVDKAARIINVRFDSNLAGDADDIAHDLTWILLYEYDDSIELLVTEASKFGAPVTINFETKDSPSKSFSVTATISSYNSSSSSRYSRSLDHIKKQIEAKLISEGIAVN